MSTVLDDVIQEIDQYKDLIFDYPHNKEDLYRRLNKCSFIAEIDHDVVYIFMINSLKDRITGKKYIPLDGELESIYINKKLPQYLKDYVFNSCSCWKIEMGLDDPTVFYIVTDNGQIEKSPKQNFAEAWEKYENRYATMTKKHIPENPDNIYKFFAMKENAGTWGKLIKMFKASKNKRHQFFPYFDKKVYYDTMTYWGDPLEAHEEQNRMTEPYNIWDIPLNHFKYVGLDRDTEFVIGEEIKLPSGDTEIIGSVDYATIKFDHPQGLTRTFKNGKDFRNYLCTIIQYINTYFKDNIIEGGIKKLYRQYFNYQWPIGEKRDNEWILRICKFKGRFIIECEVWDTGLVYKLTNFKVYTGGASLDILDPRYQFPGDPSDPSSWIDGGTGVPGGGGSVSPNTEAGEIIFDPNTTDKVKGFPLTEKIYLGTAPSEPIAPERKGWIFKGWSYDPSNTMPFDFMAPITDYITYVYAKWEEIPKVPIWQMITVNYVEIESGKTKKLVVAIDPQNATGVTISYTSQDPTIIKAWSNGNITAVGRPGQQTVVVVTATDDSGQSFTENVTVLIIPDVSPPPVTSIDGLTPDANGNINLTVENLGPDSTGNIDLPDPVFTVNGVGPDANGNVVIDSSKMSHHFQTIRLNGQQGRPTTSGGTATSIPYIKIKFFDSTGQELDTPPFRAIIGTDYTPSGPKLLEFFWSGQQTKEVTSIRAVVPKETSLGVWETGIYWDRADELWEKPWESGPYSMMMGGQGTRVDTKAFFYQPRTFWEGNDLEPTYSFMDVNVEVFWEPDVLVSGNKVHHVEITKHDLVFTDDSTYPAPTFSKLSIVKAPVSESQVSSLIPPIPDPIERYTAKFIPSFDAATENGGRKADVLRFRCKAKDLYGNWNDTSWGPPVRILVHRGPGRGTCFMEFTLSGQSVQVSKALSFGQDVGKDIAWDMPPQQTSTPGMGGYEDVGGNGLQDFILDVEWMQNITSDPSTGQWTHHPMDLFVEIFWIENVNGIEYKCDVEKFEYPTWGGTWSTLTDVNWYTMAGSYSGPDGSTGNGVGVYGTGYKSIRFDNFDMSTNFGNKIGEVLRFKSSTYDPVNKVWNDMSFGLPIRVRIVSVDFSQSKTRVFEFSLSGQVLYVTRCMDDGRSLQDQFVGPEEGWRSPEQHTSTGGSGGFEDLDGNGILDVVLSPCWMQDYSPNSPVTLFIEVFYENFHGMEWNVEVSRFDYPSWEGHWSDFYNVVWLQPRGPTYPRVTEFMEKVLNATENDIAIFGAHNSIEEDQVIDSGVQLSSIMRKVQGITVTGNIAVLDVNGQVIDSGQPIPQQQGVLRATYDDETQIPSSVPAGWANGDFVNVRIDHGHGDHPTAYMIEDNPSSPGTQIFSYLLSYSTTFPAGMALVPTAVTNDIAIFNNAGQVIDSGKMLSQFLTDANSDGKLYSRKNGTWTEVTSFPEAPQDSKQYARKNAAWTEVVSSTGGIPEAPNDGKGYVRKSQAWAQEAAFPEAPQDSKQYARKNAAWTEVVIPAAGITEAPNDGKEYVRKSQAWAENSRLVDAPSDGKFYCRKNGAWVEVPIQLVANEATALSNSQIATNTGIFFGYPE